MQGIAARTFCAMAMKLIDTEDGDPPIFWMIKLFSVHCSRDLDICEFNGTASLFVFIFFYNEFLLKH